MNRLFIGVGSKEGMIGDVVVNIIYKRRNQDSYFLFNPIE